jgi:hypothetical protein
MKKLKGFLLVFTMTLASFVFQTTSVAEESSCSFCFSQSSLPPGNLYDLKWGSLCYAGLVYCGTVQKCDPGSTPCNEFSCRTTWPGCSAANPAK